MTPVVTIRDVTFRHRRHRTVFTGLALDIPAGRTVLLGPNGAGKTTLMRLLSGQLRPATGRIEVCTATTAGGVRVGMMAQVIAPVPGLRVGEQVAYHAWLQGVRSTECDARAVAALAKVGLTDLSSRRVEELSGGELRRVGLAQALVTAPPVLLLDEPTAGLDPSHRRRLRSLLAEVARSAQATMVSTHLVDDLESSYDHVVVLDGGRVRFAGPPSDFLARDPSGAADPEAAYDSVIAEA